MFSSHATDETDYWYETVQIETVMAPLLRRKPSFKSLSLGLNGYDAYMDIPKSTPHDPYKFKKVYSPTLEAEWEVISGPHESPIVGDFRGDYTSNNPPAWMFGLRNCSN